MQEWRIDAMIGLQGFSEHRPLSDENDLQRQRRNPT